MPTVTPIPLPAARIDLPENVHVALLLGTDMEAPFTGRTDTIILVLYNSSLGKASLVSIPRDLFVYIPGYTMQRINMAYVLGGFPLVQRTIEYNFGLIPESWAFIHLDDFIQFVDDIGGLDVDIVMPASEEFCEVPVGRVHLSGYLALCYVRSRAGADDLARNVKQQLILSAILRKMLDFGQLVRLPEFYEKYRNTVNSNLGLEDLLGNLPLLFRIGDEGHLSFFRFDWNGVKPWRTPPPGNAAVLLPIPAYTQQLFSAALRAVNQPQPETDRVATWQALLTPTPTSTPMPPGITRAQLAVSLVNSKYGMGFSPPAATGIYVDVPAGYWAAAWIEKLYNDGVSYGCRSNPLAFCPEDNLTSAELAVFLLKGKYGRDYQPPAATGLYADVPVSYWASAWIEQLAFDGISAGCGGEFFCPEGQPSQGQVDGLLAKVFGTP
jgi:LCP family protein required for cell wall assembly